MLGGADPARIQCLTFTKAAAAEMAIRLQQTLGNWVTLDDPALDKALRELGMAPGAGLRGKARALFARGARPARRHAHRHHPCVLPVAAAPLPAGGAALAAFPAGGRPRRRRRADRGARGHAGRGASGRDARRRWRCWPGSARSTGFGRLVDALRADTERLAGLKLIGADGVLPALMRTVGLRADDDRDSLIGRAVSWPDEALLRRGGAGGAPARRRDRRRRSPARLLEWLSLPEEDRAEHWQAWRDEFLAGRRQVARADASSSTRSWASRIPSCRRSSWPSRTAWPRWRTSFGRWNWPGSRPRW